jgi:hypothetical protein
MDDLGFAEKAVDVNRFFIRKRGLYGSIRPTGRHGMSASYILLLEKSDRQ